VYSQLQYRSTNRWNSAILTWLARKWHISREAWGFLADLTSPPTSQSPSPSLAKLLDSTEMAIVPHFILMARASLPPWQFPVKVFAPLIEKRIPANLIYKSNLLLFRYVLTHLRRLNLLASYTNKHINWSLYFSQLTFTAYTKWWISIKNKYSIE
jgi:hypothetical protein